MQNETIPIIEHLDFPYEPLACESDFCEEAGRGSHEADWFVNFSCGDGLLWCNFRFMVCTQHEARGGLLRCQICGGLGRAENWTPVRIS